jgi:hypothetical protein
MYDQCILFININNSLPKKITNDKNEIKLHKWI